MDPFEAIKKERKTGKVICGDPTGARIGREGAAAAFGLKDDEKPVPRDRHGYGAGHIVTSCTATWPTATG